VHGARADDDEETVIALLDDLNSFFAALEDCGDGVCWSRNLRGEELGLNERVVAEDSRVVNDVAVVNAHCV